MPDTGNPPGDGPVVDMGAYESLGGSCFCCSTEICVTIPDCTPAGQPGDLGGDGAVTVTDFLVLLADWGL